MPYKPPGKKAFITILGLAAITGVVFYFLAGLAAPEPLIPLERYDEGLPPPAGILSNGTEEANESASSIEIPDASQNR